MNERDISLPFGTQDPPPRVVRLSTTLSFYIARQVFIGVMIALLALGMIAVVVDLIELLRRAGSRPDATFGVVFTMAWLHLPFFLQQLLPFAVLFGVMFAFQRLTRTHELVAARAIGVSVWQFLTPALAVAVTLGAMTVTVFNPIGAVLIAKYENMERVYFSHRASMVAVSQGGLWLRQPHGDGDLLLHARQMNRNPPTLKSVTIFFYDDDARFIARADAASARLEPGNWVMLEPLHSFPDGSSETLRTMKIPTDLTPDRIKDNFEAPETTSFWDLPGFIDNLEAVGFSATEHRLHWHRLLALPSLLAAMLLIGVAFSLRLVRKGGTGILVAGGLITGFAFYILSDVIFALGLSGRLPAAMAAWTPAGVAILLGVTTLLHLEDG